MAQMFSMWFCDYDLAPPRSLGNQEAMQQYSCGWQAEINLHEQKCIKKKEVIQQYRDGQHLRTN